MKEENIKILKQLLKQFGTTFDSDTFILHLQEKKCLTAKEVKDLDKYSLDGIKKFQIFELLYNKPDDMINEIQSVFESLCLNDVTQFLERERDQKENVVHTYRRRKNFERNIEKNVKTENQKSSNRHYYSLAGITLSIALAIAVALALQNKGSKLSPSGKQYDEMARSLIKQAESDKSNTHLHIATLNGETMNVIALLQKDIHIIDKKNKMNWTSLLYATALGHTKIVLTLLEKGADITTKVTYTLDNQTYSDVTALHLASEKGHIDIVKALIEAHANMNVKDNNGNAPIHLAALNGKTSVASALLAKDRGLVSIKNNFNNTPLHLAAWRGHKETVLALLHKGADINAKGNYIDEPYLTEPSVTALHLSAIEGHLQTLTILLIYNGDLNSKDYDGNTVLHLAAGNGRTKIVLAILDRNPGMVDTKNNENATALHLASKGGHTETVLNLLDKGANINATGEFYVHSDTIEPFFKGLQSSKAGENVELIQLLFKQVNDEWSSTALQLAVIEGHAETVRALLSHNADSNIIDQLGNTLLHYAVLNGNMDTIIILIKHNSSQINTKNILHQTPLSIATEKQNDVNIVQVLINFNADLYLKDYFGNTPIHYAALNGQTDTVICLLKHSPALINLKSDLNYSPLVYASWKGHTETALVLLDKGADINAKANYVNETDGTESSVTAIHLAAKEGHVEIVRELLNYQAVYNAKDVYGYLPIHLAAFNGKASSVIAFLEHDSSLARLTNNINETILHLAAVNGHTDTVLALLNYGTDINAKSNYYDDPKGIEPSVTALHLSSKGGHIETVQALLSHQADSNLKDHDGHTALYLAVLNKKLMTIHALIEHNATLINVTNNVNETPLHYAIRKGFTEIASVLQEKKANYGTDPIGIDQAESPLHRASRNGDVETARILLSNCFDSNVKGQFNDTALHLASYFGKTNMVTLLLDYNIGLINVKNEDNETPLHLAAWKGHIETVLVLLDKGAKINEKANHHVKLPVGTEPSLTALHIAAKEGHVEIVQTLLSHHAESTMKDFRGDTSLHIAAYYGKTSTVITLVQNNPDLLNIKNDNGETALHHAIATGNKETELVLIRLGADTNLVDPYSNMEYNGIDYYETDVEIIEVDKM